MVPRIFFVFCLSNLFLFAPSYAWEWQGGLSGGYNRSELTIDGYHGADGWQLRGEIHFPLFSFEGGFLNLGKFELSGTSDSYVEVEGFEVGLLNVFGFCPGWGLMEKSGGISGKRILFFWAVRWVRKTEAVSGLVGVCSLRGRISGVLI